MKKTTLIFPLAACLLLAACSGGGSSSSSTTPAPSSEPASSSPSSSEVPQSSSSSSSEEAPVETTIEAIKTGKIGTFKRVIVSGVVTFIQSVSDSITRFYFQDGAYGIGVVAHENRDKIVVGNSITVNARTATTSETLTRVINVQEGYGSIEDSSKTYTCEAITSISSLEELSSKYGCWASLSPISYASSVDNDRIFNASYNNLALRVQFQSELDETAVTEFVNEVKAGKTFTYTGPIIYSQNFHVYSMDHVKLVEQA